MDKIINMSSKERLELFQDASGSLKISIPMIEKDFWICWVLSKLFNDMELSENLMFKGGTSLSKGYKIIERFSEDLDIILSKEKIIGENEELFKSSKKKQRKFTQEISTQTAHYISTTLKDKIIAVLGGVVQVYTDTEYTEENPNYKPKEIDNRSLHIIYPNASTDSYLRPDILLEIGILSAWVPNEPRNILPYIAEIYPQLELPPAIVPTIKAQRTFWDKATILHREFYRPNDTYTPVRYSRHYYDLYKMAKSDIRSMALGDYNLLTNVVERKDKLFHCAWARYDLAKPGTLRLLPNNNNRDLLRRDYLAMQAMIFGDIPYWDVILNGLQELEDEINRIR